MFVERSGCVEINEPQIFLNYCKGGRKLDCNFVVKSNNTTIAGRLCHTIS